MFRFGKITVTRGFWLLIVGTLLTGAVEVLPSVAFAALLHEFGHLLVLRVFGVSVEGIAFTSFGAEIRADTRYIPYWKDILCTLAGPMVNILAALVFARMVGDHLLAGANLLQGCFNLLPLTGLDGARILHLIISWAWDPVRADRICRIVELIFAAMLTLAALYLMVRYSTGGFIMIAVSGVFVSIWREMRGK